MEYTEERLDITEDRVEELQCMGYDIREEDIKYLKDEVYEMRLNRDNELKKSYRKRKNKHKDYLRVLDNSVNGNTKYLMYEDYHYLSKEEMKSKIGGKETYNYRYLFNEYEDAIRYKYEVVVKIRKEYRGHELLGVSEYVISLEFVRYNLEDNTLSKLYSEYEYEFSVNEFDEVMKRVSKVTGNVGNEVYFSSKYYPNTRIINEVFNTIKEVNGYLSKVLGLGDILTEEDDEIFTENEYKVRSRGEERLSKDYIIVEYMRNWDGKSKVDEDLLDRIVGEYLDTRYFTKGTSLSKIKNDLYDVIKLSKIKNISGKSRNYNMRYRDDRDKGRSSVKKILGKVKGYDLEDIEEGVLDNELVRVKTEELVYRS